MAYWITRGNLDLLFWERGGYIQVVVQIYENDFFTKCYGENYT